LATSHIAGAVGYVRDAPPTPEPIVRTALLSRDLIAEVILAKRASLLY
jgi:hypothetical protein